MTHFDEIYEIAAHNYGLVTTAQAKEAGVIGVELARYVKDGRLEKLGHGLYKLTRHVPTDYDRFAEAVAQVGQGAYLYGDAVLAMHGLAFANPSRIQVATSRRVRKKLPAWIRVVRPKEPTTVVYDEGIPAQSVSDAILASGNSVMRERLVDAAREARRQRLLTLGEYEKLQEAFSELEDTQ